MFEFEYVCQRRLTLSVTMRAFREELHSAAVLLVWPCVFVWCGCRHAGAVSEYGQGWGLLESGKSGRVALLCACVCMCVCVRARVCVCVGVGIMRACLRVFIDGVLPQGGACVCKDLHASAQCCRNVLQECVHPFPATVTKRSSRQSWLTVLFHCQSLVCVSCCAHAF